MNELGEFFDNNINSQNYQSNGLNYNSQEDKLPFNKFISLIKDKISTGVYKITYLQIKKYVNIYTDTKEVSQLLQIKLKLMLKIVQKKLKKYEIDSNMNDNGIISSILTWLKEIEKDLDKLVYLVHPDVNPNVKENKGIIQNIIEFYLKLLYFKLILHNRIGNIEKVCALLGISINLINQSLNFISNSNNLILIQKIYLLLVNICIRNHDYINALIHQQTLLEFCFRELMFRIDIYKGLLDNDIYKKKINKPFIKTFQNIAYALCLRGICEERIGKITKAIEAYKQSKWFSLKFLIEENPCFVKYIVNVTNRASVFHDIFTILKETKSKEVIVALEPTVSSVIPNKLKSIIASGHYGNFEKYFKAEELISNLRQEELEIPSNNLIKAKKAGNQVGRCNSDIMLSNLRLLDTFRNNKFQPTLYSMNKINIAYFDIDSKEKLQRAINEVHSSNNKYLNDSRHSSLPGKYTGHHLSMPSTPNKSRIKRRKDSSMISCSSNKKSTMQNSKLFSGSMILEKYNYDKKLFSKSFKKKKKYLDKLDLKEYDFQKKILRLKTNEKYPMDLKNKIETEAEAYFNFNRLKITNVEHRVKFQPNITAKEFKESQLQNSLENTVLKSLNLRKFTEFNKTLEINHKKRKISESHSFIEEEYINKAKVNQKNQIIMEGLNDNIQFIEYKATGPIKNSKRNKAKTRSNTNKLFLIMKPNKRKFDLDKFIRTSNK